MAAYKTPRRQSMDTSMGEDAIDEARYSVDSKTGSKRLYSNRASQRPTILGDGSYFDEEYPLGKRPRSNDWPLPPAPVLQAVSPRPNSRSNSRLASRPNSRSNSRATSRCHSRQSTASPPPGRHSLHRSRPSRFLEGSMNDKVSQLPPKNYLLHEEDLRERFDDNSGYNGNVPTSARRFAKPKGLMQQSNVSMADWSFAEASDVSQKSSIFRFGTKLAASMKPSNWKIFSRQPKVAEETEQQKTMREQRESAQRMYFELKNTGYFQDRAIVQPGFNKPSMDQTPRLKHDSGVELNDHYNSRDNTPTEDKRQGRVFVETPDCYMDRPTSKTSQRLGDESTPRRSFHAKTASMATLRGMNSSAHLQNVSPGEYPSVRKMPSRKEFQKQQRLVKRVSDLEVKLENARRQLTETLGEPYDDEYSFQSMDYQDLYQAPPRYPPPPPPRAGRSHFVPGALATLHSERLLSGYVDPEAEAEYDDGDQFGDIGKAITTQDGMANVADMSDSPSGQLQAANSAGQLSPSSRAPQNDSVGRDIEYGSGLSDIESQGEGSDSHRISLKAMPSNGVKVVDIKSSTSRAIKQEYSDDDALASKGPAQPPVVKKKRRSAFEGIADDGGRYQPTGETTSDSDSGPDTSARPIKKVRSSRNRRLVNERTPEPATAKTKISSNSYNERQSATRHAAQSNRADSTRPKSILVKLKMPQNSPPTTSNAAPKHSKPSTVASRTSTTSSRRQSRELIANQDLQPLHHDEGIPPVPKIPQNMRMPSGEYLSMPGAVGSKIPRPHSTTGTNEKSSKAQEPDDWPEDLEIF